MVRDLCSLLCGRNCGRSQHPQPVFEGGPFPRKKGVRVSTADDSPARERAHENSSRTQQVLTLCPFFADPSAIEAVSAYQGTAGIKIKN
jgi:hypothetical protein